MEFFEKIEKTNEENSSIRINQYQKLCIEKLEERIKYLQERADKIKKELQIANSRKNGTIDPKMLVFMEIIQDLLHENKTLEKYIRSENFRIYDETILSLKYKLETLSKNYKEFSKIRKELEREKRVKTKLLESKQKKIDKINNK